MFKAHRRLYRSTLGSRVQKKDNTVKGNIREVVLNDAHAQVSLGPHIAQLPLQNHLIQAFGFGFNLKTWVLGLIPFRPTSPSSPDCLVK